MIFFLNMWLYHEFVEEIPIFKQTCWIFIITHQMSEGPVLSLLFLHSSNKWILLCINLVVTVVPKKPSDVSFVGKEDAHRMIFGHLDCKRCVDRRRSCSPSFTSLLWQWFIGWLVSLAAGFS